MESYYDDPVFDPKTQLRALTKSLQAWLGRAMVERSLSSNFVLFSDSASDEEALRLAQCLESVLCLQKAWNAKDDTQPTVVSFLDVPAALERNDRDLYTLMQDHLTKCPETDVMIVTGLSWLFNRDVWERERVKETKPQKEEAFPPDPVRIAAEMADERRVFKGLQYGRNPKNFKETPVFAVLCIPEWLYVPLRTGSADFMNWSFHYDLTRWNPQRPEVPASVAAPPFPAP